MTKPVTAELAAVMDRVFATGAEGEVSQAGALSNKNNRPLWKIFAWVLILLLLAEPTIVNRLKR